MLKYTPTFFFTKWCCWMSFNFTSPSSTNFSVLSNHDWLYLVCFLWQYSLDWPIFRTIGKSKELKWKSKKRSCRFTQIKQLHIQRSTVQITVHKYKVLGCVTTSSSFGRRAKWSDEINLVKIFRINSGTIKAQPFHELEAAVTPAPLCTVK